MFKHMKKLYHGHRKDDDSDDSKMLKHMNKLHKKEEELDDNKMMQVIFHLSFHMTQNGLTF